MLYFPVLSLYAIEPSGLQRYPAASSPKIGDAPFEKN